MLQILPLILTVNLGFLLQEALRLSLEETKSQRPVVIAFCFSKLFVNGMKYCNLIMFMWLLAVVLLRF